MLGLGTFFEVTWMVAVSGAYLAFLWLPITPEKVVTLAIAMALLRFLFPHDEKTLGILRNFFEKNRNKKKNDRRREERSARKKSCKEHQIETEKPLD